MSIDFDWFVKLKPRQDFSIATFNRMLQALEAAGFEWEVAMFRRPPKPKEWDTIPYYDLGIKVKAPYTMYTCSYEGVARACIKAICDRTDVTESQIKIIPEVKP